MEGYNYIESDKANTKRCVYPWGDYEKIGTFTHCEGENCMGWVHEFDAYGNPTGRGRCGMTHQIVITMPMVHTPYFGSEKHWWESPKVEG